MKKMDPKVLKKIQKLNEIKEGIDENVIEIRLITNTSENPSSIQNGHNRDKKQEDFDFKTNRYE